MYTNELHDLMYGLMKDAPKYMAICSNHWKYIPSPHLMATIEGQWRMTWESHTFVCILVITLILILIIGIVIVIVIIIIIIIIISSSSSSSSSSPSPPSSSSSSSSPSSPSAMHKFVRSSLQLVFILKHSNN